MADKLYQCMKELAKRKGIKASPQHDLYKMIPPYFINAFYSDLGRKKNSDKITVVFYYEVKYAYFDDLTLSIVDPVSNIKLTDKVRANSVIACKSVIENERIEYDFDGKEESWQFLAERVFEHIEEWYRSFETEVKEKYGSLEKYFLRNKEKYPKQAALVYFHEERYDEAEECLRRMPRKMNSARFIHPKTAEQAERLVNSGADKYGEDNYLRDDMDCHFDYVKAKKKGLEWTAERAGFGLTKAESGERPDARKQVDLLG